VTRGRIKLPAEITKTKNGREIVITARLRPVLEMVRTSPLTGEDHKPAAFVFGNAAGEAVGSPKKAWEVCVLKAHGIKPAWDKAKKRLAPEVRQQLAVIDLHFHDLRREAGSRWLEGGAYQLLDQGHWEHAGDRFEIPTESNLHQALKDEAQRLAMVHDGFELATVAAAAWNHRVAQRVIRGPRRA
jgi:hypothetical protein